MSDGRAKVEEHSFGCQQKLVGTHDLIEDRSGTFVSDKQTLVVQSQTASHKTTHILCLPTTGLTEKQ